MSNITTHTPKTEDQKLLVLHLKSHDVDRILQFRAGADRVRVVGSNGKADVVLAAAGVLPVHCYFEREGDDLYVACGQREAPLSVNYVPVLTRARLAGRSVVELGTARLHATVSEAPDDTPELGPSGTAVIDRAALHYALDGFRTTRFEAASVLDNAPTTSFKLSEMLESESESEPELEAETIAIRRSSLPAATAEAESAAVQITERIRALTPSQPPAESSAPERRPSPIPPLPMIAITARPSAPAPAPGDVAADPQLLETARAVPHPSERPPAFSGSAPAAPSVPSVRPEPLFPRAPAALPAGSASSPVAERLLIAPVAPSARPAPLVAEHKPSLHARARGDFTRWQRERRLLPFLFLLCIVAIAFASFGKQSLELWRAARSHPTTHARQAPHSPRAAEPGQYAGALPVPELARAPGESAASANPDQAPSLAPGQAGKE